MNNCDFKGILGKYRVVETQDHSQTLWSEHFDENCHSLAGADEETCYNYVNGCQVPLKLENGPVELLEVGFGPGKGVTNTYQQLEQAPPGHPLTFVSLELDPELVLWAAKNNNESFQHFPSLTDLKRHQHGEQEWFEAEKKGNTLIVLIGDARKVLPLWCKKRNPSFNVIYQDPFSPKKNPTLWSKQWFELLKKYSRHDVIMSTYSASISIRKAMLEAGWIIENRKGLKTKRSSTRARLTGEQDYAIVEKLNSSSVEALDDSNIIF
jgi:tRNA U34 5-methylaminomethyl-2-thiouridine-forming methyltransferase MnmC